MKNSSRKVIPIVEEFIKERNKIRDKIHLKGKNAIPNYICDRCEQAYKALGGSRIKDLRVKHCPRKEGWLYFCKNCPQSHFLLAHLLNEKKIDFECNFGPKDMFIGYFPPNDDYTLGPQRMYLLKKLKTLICLNCYVDKEVRNIIKKFGIVLVVVINRKVPDNKFPELGTHLAEYIELDTDVLLFEGEKFCYYDRNASIEKSIEKIIKKMVSSLNRYAAEIRGNDHDRFVKSFIKIGEELGYLPDTEIRGIGTQIDCAWYDKKGNINVAIEVERIGWKKDLLSTWETEPHLAIIAIIGKTRTDILIDTLRKFAPVKYTPHKLLLVNTNTQNVFLFDKQQLVGKYKLQ